MSLTFAQLAVRHSKCAQVIQKNNLVQAGLFGGHSSQLLIEYMLIFSAPF